MSLHLGRPFISRACVLVPAAVDAASGPGLGDPGKGSAAEGMI